MDKVLAELESIVGRDSVSVPDTDIHSRFKKVPIALLSPGTEEQISEILKICNREQLSVLPQGSGTKLYSGNAPVNIDIVISTKNLSNLTEHIKDDMIAVTQAGIKVSELQKILSSHNQFLAMDPPNIEKGCTIGGVISTNDYGPLRHRYGCMRENVLALKFIRPDGCMINSGAKVVKNVAGYDIHKFMVGTFGTLGIITEATLRLYPVPEKSATVIVNLENLNGIDGILNELLNSDFVFNSLELATGKLLQGSGPYILAVKFQNIKKAVESQVTQVCDFFNSKGFKDLSTFEDKTEQEFWTGISNITSNPGKISLELRIRVPISRVTELFTYFDKLIANSGSIIKFSASAGIGVINISIENTEDVLSTQLGNITEEVYNLDGFLSILHAPYSVTENFDVLGKLEKRLIDLMRDIKFRIDPLNIMNPGIFSGNF